MSDLAAGIRYYAHLCTRAAHRTKNRRVILCHSIGTNDVASRRAGAASMESAVKPFGLFVSQAIKSYRVS
jgi:hypothetical protein